MEPKAIIFAGTSLALGLHLDLPFPWLLLGNIFPCLLIVVGWLNFSTT